MQVENNNRCFSSHHWCGTNMIICLSACPVIKRKTEGGRTFTMTACQAWNSLLLSMQKIALLNSFRNSLWKKIFEEQQLLNHFIL